MKADSLSILSIMYIEAQKQCSFKRKQEKKTLK